MACWNRPRQAAAAGESPAYHVSWDEAGTDPTRVDHPDYNPAGRRRRAEVASLLRRCKIRPAKLWRRDPSKRVGKHVVRIVNRLQVDCILDVGANAGQYAKMLRQPNVLSLTLHRGCSFASPNRLAGDKRPLRSRPADQASAVRLAGHPRTSSASSGEAESD